MDLSQTGTEPEFETQPTSRRLFCGSDCGAATEEGGVATHIGTGNDSMISDSCHPKESQTIVAELGYEDKMNALRLQEMECRVKESQLKCELQQIAVNRANEELQQMRDIHELHINEMQLKLDRMKKELRNNYRGDDGGRASMLL